MSVNVAGLLSLTRDLAPMLIASANAERPSTIVNIGSVMGTVTQSENAYAYSASEAAVHHLTRILTQEFAGRQVTINAIARAVSDQHDPVCDRRRGGRGAGRKNGSDGPA